MAWARRTRTLAAQPPQSQVLALRQAAAWAQMWAIDADQTIGEARPNAPGDPMRLRAREASLETTSAYLALLLALVGQDRTMQPLIGRLGKVFSEPAELPADLELLTELLYERLPVAVHHASTRPARPPALAQAAHHALGLRDQTLSGAELAHQLYESLAKLLGRFLDQLSQEEVFEAHGDAPLQAVLTKAPAAFFARMAVGLCTDPRRVPDDTMALRDAQVARLAMGFMARRRVDRVCMGALVAVNVEQSAVLTYRYRRPYSRFTVASIRDLRAILTDLHARHLITALVAWAFGSLGVPLTFASGEPVPPADSDAWMTTALNFQNLPAFRQALESARAKAVVPNQRAL